MAQLNCFETDYVYSDMKTEEYKNIHITLKVDGDYFDLCLYSDEFINKKQMEIILNQLAGAFRNLRISIVKECRVILIVKDVKYNVDVYDTGIMVSDISMLDD